MIKYVLTKSHVISCTGLCEKWDSGRENALGRGHRFVERNSLYKKKSSVCAHKPQSRTEAQQTEGYFTKKTSSL